MLGALAIVIAILIVLNAQDKKDQQTTAADGDEYDHRNDPVPVADGDARLDR